jgi:molybdopterin synthase catalytic subunit
MRIEIASAAFDPYAELRTFGSDARAGACASFIGLCRSAGPDGPIAWLELEHYPTFTEQEVERMADTIMGRHGLLDLIVIHRSGRVAPGEAIVLVAALGEHRASAFAAVEQLMDYLKSDAPFWKQEMRVDGPHWIEPTPEDRRRRAAHEVK